MQSSIPSSVAIGRDGRTILDRAERPRAPALAFCLKGEVPLPTLMWRDRVKFNLRRPSTGAKHPRHCARCGPFGLTSDSSWTVEFGE